MIIPAAQAKQNFDVHQKIRHEHLEKLIDDYFTRNIRVIESRFNRAVNEYMKEARYSTSVHFPFPDSWRSVSFEVKSYFADRLEKHVKQFGYKRTTGLYIDYGIWFEVNSEGR